MQPRNRRALAPTSDREPPAAEPERTSARATASAAYRRDSAARLFAARVDAAPRSDRRVQSLCHVDAGVFDRSADRHEGHASDVGTRRRFHRRLGGRVLRVHGRADQYRALPRLATFDTRGDRAGGPGAAADTTCANSCSTRAKYARSQHPRGASASSSGCVRLRRSATS